MKNVAREFEIAPVSRGAIELDQRHLDLGIASRDGPSLAGDHSPAAGSRRRSAGRRSTAWDRRLRDTTRSRPAADGRCNKARVRWSGFWGACGRFVSLSAKWVLRNAACWLCGDYLANHLFGGGRDIGPRPGLKSKADIFHPLVECEVGVRADRSEGRTTFPLDEEKVLPYARVRAASERMLGMLKYTSFARHSTRSQQVTLTARTGTLFNLAYGELRVAIMPALAHSGSRTGALEGTLDCPKAKSPHGRAAAAVAAAAVDRNWRRVSDDWEFMGRSLLRRLRSIRLS